MQQTESLKSIWQTYHDTGCAHSRERLVMSCMPLVRHIVKRIAGQLPAHLDLEDLVEAGVFGLVDAIERYDARDDAKFETYAALRIRGAVIDELRSRDFVPRSLRRKSRQINQARADLMAKNDDAPTTAQLADALNIDPKEMESALAEVEQIAGVTSLYDQKGSSSDSDGGRVIDLIADPNSASPITSMEVEEKKRLLTQSVQRLPEQEQIVITLYYFEGMLLKEIGELLKVSESRVCQIRSRALILLKLWMKQLA